MSDVEDFAKKMANPEEFAAMVHHVVASTSDMGKALDNMLGRRGTVFEMHRSSLEVLRAVLQANEIMVKKLYEENQGMRDKVMETLDKLNKRLGLQ